MALTGLKVGQAKTLTSAKNDINIL